MGIPGIRPIPTNIPPHKLRRQQPPDDGHPPPQPRNRRATYDHQPSVRHSPASHHLPGRAPPRGGTLRIGGAGRCQSPCPQHPERQAPTSAGHHSPPRGHTGHPASQHCTPKQTRRVTRPTTSTRQGEPPVHTGPGVLHAGGAERGRRVPGLQPPEPPSHPTPRPPASTQGMGAARGLAHILPQGGHDGTLALLRGQHRRPSQHSLHQTYTG